MSTYIKLSTLEYPRHIGDIERDPLGMSDYALVDWVDPPPFNPHTQTRSQLLPQQHGNRWRMVWEVVQIPDAEMAAKIKAERNQKLKDSDWTQVADAPVNKTAWAVYRQALRDISTQTGFPWDVTWPTQPV